MTSNGKFPSFFFQGNQLKQRTGVDNDGYGGSTDFWTENPGLATLEHQEDTTNTDDTVPWCSRLLRELRMRGNERETPIGKNQAKNTSINEWNGWKNFIYTHLREVIKNGICNEIALYNMTSLKNILKYIQDQQHKSGKTILIFIWAFSFLSFWTFQTGVPALSSQSSVSGRLQTALAWKIQCNFIL